MTNKEFDQWLRGLMSSVGPDLNARDWDSFVQRVEKAESNADTGFDDSIRNALENIGAGAVPDWEHMENMLETDEHQFDHEIRQSIEKFEVPYNASTWPSLDGRLTEEERIRRRLISAKVLEIAAILILFLTFYNFFPVFKATVLPSDSEQASVQLNAASTPSSLKVESATTPVVNMTAQDNVHQYSISKTVNTSTPQLQVSPQSVSWPGRLSVMRHPEMVTPVETYASQDLRVIEESGSAVDAEPSRTDIAAADIMPSRTLSGLMRQPHTRDLGSILPIIPISASSSHLRIGMMTSADFNTLYVPDERFYSQGRYINFSAKEISADGYSAGASLLFDFKGVMVETGLMYSSKNFSPDRSLFIGNTLDQHTLDFENITLNIVSLPILIHWKVDGRGAWRFYATSGVALNVIGSANYDLFAENIFTSSAVQDPLQVQNRREIQRVREHMLDGATFSSKGYLTAVGGLGLERYLNRRMSLFVQPMYQYQIPFFGLIDQNGKHLQTGSLLFGTRVSL